MRRLDQQAQAVSPATADYRPTDPQSLVQSL
jgi:hypothetical protein